MGAMITPRPVLYVLGPFRLLAPLGQGGFAEVWRGEHIRQGVPVALKIERAPALDGAVQTAEVRALAGLDHPNVLMVFDHGVLTPENAPPGLTPGCPWIATELCSGGALAGVAPRNWNQLRRVAVDILAGLAYAHARGVLHLDLTPDNVLIASSGDLRPGLKLGDFGLASDPREPSRQRRTGVAGTPPYMAPEQFGDEPGALGPWSDLYAFGCLLWRLSCGDAPFGSTRPPEVLAAAHSELELPAFEPKFATPPGFEVLVRALLEKAPHHRVQSAAETLSALDVVDGQENRSVPADWRAGVPPRRVMRLVGAGLGLHPFRPIPLVGRDAERDVLWRTLLHVRATGEARLVQISGQPGIGRGALRRWLRERTLETGAARVVEVRGEGVEPRAALAAALAATYPCPPALRTGMLDAGVEALLDAARVHGTLLIDLGLADDTPGIVDLAQDLLTPALSAPRPGFGLLVVVGTAPAAPQRGVSMALGPLAPAHQVQLVEGVLGLGGRVAQEVRERAAGNPGVAVSLMRSLVRAGSLIAEESGFVAASEGPLFDVGETAGAADRTTTCLVSQASAQRRKGAIAEAQGCLEEAHARARADKDDRALARVARARGVLSLYRGHLGAAGRSFQQAQALFTRLGVQPGVALCLLHRGEVARWANNPALLRELLAQAQAALDDAPSEVGAAHVQLLTAEAAQDVGDRGCDGFDRALVLARRAGSRPLVARAALGLGLSAAPGVDHLGWLGYSRHGAGLVGDLLLAATARACALALRCEAGSSDAGALLREAEAVCGDLEASAGFHPAALSALERGATAGPVGASALLSSAAQAHAQRLQK